MQYGRARRYISSLFLVVAALWRHVLFGPEHPAEIALSDVEARWRTLAKEAHPDRGGDAARFNQITDAVRLAREELT